MMPHARFPYHAFVATLATALATLLAAAPARAQYSLRIGDNDGYGFGLPDNGFTPATGYPGLGGSGSNYDGRSAAEKAATDGAELTDVYSALYPNPPVCFLCPIQSPHTFSVGHVLFPVPQLIGSAVLTVDMGDFQASVGGPIRVLYNGLLQSWAFDDGFTATVVRHFVLDAATVASINATGMLDVTIDHDTSGDLIAFDYFQLDATLPGVPSTAPEPAGVALVAAGLGLIGLAAARRLTIGAPNDRGA